MLVYNESYQLTWLILHEPICNKGNAIKVKNCKMKYLRMCGYPGGISSKITIIDGDISSYIIHDICMFKDVLRQFSDSMHNIARYNQEINNSKEIVCKRSPDIFDSASALLQHGTPPYDQTMTLLCNIIEGNHYKMKSTDSYSYIFIAQCEQVRFNIIQWEDCRAYRYVGDTINKGSPVVFGNVSLEQTAQGEKYFKITANDSFIVYDFVAAFCDLFITGEIDNRINNKRRLRKCKHVTRADYNINMKMCEVISSVVHCQKKKIHVGNRNIKIDAVVRDVEHNETEHKCDDG